MTQEQRGETGLLFRILRMPPREVYPYIVRGGQRLSLPEVFREILKNLEEESGERVKRSLFALRSWYGLEGEPRSFKEIATALGVSRSRPQELMRAAEGRIQRRAEWQKQLLQFVVPTPEVMEALIESGSRASALEVEKIILQRDLQKAKRAGEQAPRLRAENRRLRNALLQSAALSPEDWQRERDLLAQGLVALRARYLERGSEGKFAFSKLNGLLKRLGISSAFHLALFTRLGIQQFFGIGPGMEAQVRELLGAIEELRSKP